MHFRQFVLKGIIIGAALFFPTNALAEKEDHAQKVPVQSEKAVEMVTDVQKQKLTKVNKISKSQAQLKHEKPALKKTAAAIHSNKPEQKKKTLPEQASQIAKEARQAVGKKNKQVKSITLSAKKATNHGVKKGVIKKQSTLSINEETSTKQQDVTETPTEKLLDKPSGKSPEQPFHTTESKAKTKLLDSKRMEPVSEINKQMLIVNVKSMTKKVSSSDRSELPKKTPESGKGFPNDSLTIISSQSNNHSGGSSKDRTNLGQSTFSLTDKWFIRWERYWTLELNQSFVSQSHKFCNQWTNAPPFQPPKPFLFS